MSTVNSTSVSPSMSPNSLGNAPKFGTRVPNRVFVGGISSSTTETELYELFATYGEVRATKIIADRAGVSKGYGFVTFATEDEAEGILKEENVMLKDRKLNIAPAIRKQPLSRYFGSQDMGSDTTGSNSARLTPRATPEWNVASPEPAQVFSNGTVFYHNGTPYVYPGGGIVFATAAGADPACQYSQQAQQAYYPIIYSPTLYLPQQQYQYPSPATAQSQWTGQQMRWAAQVNYGQNPSPHASATSAPHYVYTTNGSSNNNNNNTGAAVTSSGSASGINPVQQQQPKGAAGDSIGITSNGCPSTLAYAPAYAAYAPVHQSAYQQHVMSSPRTQDYTDAPPPIETISTAEPPPSHPHQESSTGSCDSRAVQLVRHASNQFARPPPNYYQRGCQNTESNYHSLMPPFEPPPISNHNNHHHQQQQQQHHQNNNSNSNGYNRGYQRRGGQHQQSSYGQSRHNSPQQQQQQQQHQQQHNNNNRPRFHYKSMSYNDSLTENKCLLTPPKTPMVGDCSSLSDTSVTDTVKKIEALSI